MAAGSPRVSDLTRRPPHAAAVHAEVAAGVLYACRELRTPCQLDVRVSQEPGEQYRRRDAVIIGSGQQVRIYYHDELPQRGRLQTADDGCPACARGSSGHSGTRRVVSPDRVRPVITTRPLAHGARRGGDCPVPGQPRTAADGPGRRTARIGTLDRRRPDARTRRNARGPAGAGCVRCRCRLVVARADTLRRWSDIAELRRPVPVATPAAGQRRRGLGTDGGDVQGVPPLSAQAVPVPGRGRVAVLLPAEGVLAPVLILAEEQVD
jgi:hypothetical protein